jgi:hypothetical protein
VTVKLFALGTDATVKMPSYAAWLAPKIAILLPTARPWPVTLNVAVVPLLVALVMATGVRPPRRRTAQSPSSA